MTIGDGDHYVFRITSKVSLELEFTVLMENLLITP
jgi:hypothetical protein